MDTNLNVHGVITGRLAAPIATPVGTMLTQTLENQLYDLESLRDSIARAGKKDIEDVRDFGHTAAKEMLRGIEQPVTYRDLLDFIDYMKDGIALRRAPF